MKNAACIGLAIAIGLAATEGLRAERMAPGPYNGYFSETRWGDQILHLGPYHTFVSEEAAKELARHKGKPLEVEVSDISQPLNPGAGMIRSVGEVKQHASFPGLRIEAVVEIKKVKEGEGALVEITLKNETDEEIIIGSAKLAVVLVANSAANEKAIEYEDPDDRAYWYYRYGFFSLGGKEKPRSILCHQVLLRWSDGKFSGIEVDPARNRVMKGDRISVEANGTFSASYRAAKALPEGEYELFVYLTSGNLSSTPGPMSARLPFDVVAKESP